MTGPLHGHGHPGSTHEVGEAFGGANDERGNRVRTNTGNDALAGRPGSFDRLSLHAFDKIGINALGGATQHQLAKSR